MELNGNKKRGNAPKPLASHIVKLTKPIFGERGFADASIISDWAEIAGEYLANHCVPEKIYYPRNQKKRGTLHLRIDNGGLALHLQHLESLVIERINAYFGFGAIECIRITQGPLPKIPKNTFLPPRPLSKKEEQNLLDCLIDVADDDLHKALERLGRAILSKTPKELT